MSNPNRSDELAIAHEVINEAMVQIRLRLATPLVLAQLLTSLDSPVSPRIAGRALASRLAELVTRVVRDGWTPADLGHVVRRQADERHVGALAHLLRQEAERHSRDRVHHAWLDELHRLGRAQPVDALTPAGIEHGLAIATVLALLPPIEAVLPPPGVRHEVADRPAGPDQAHRLAKVRALLAKAESTEFADEAEALSAKAQELISRYALDRLLGSAASHGAPDIRVRRLWLDPPYVLPKAMLVEAVARANRCRTAVSEQLGFSTVIGDPDDLDDVELLVTSLLVQAGSAMHALGRQRAGARSRTASFRRAFLLAYASRIGERLTAAAADVAAASPHGAELVPVLRQRSEHVDAAFDQAFPRLRTRRTTYTNGAGWAAGTAAADRARLSPPR